jgi:hypothetical protein
MYHKSKHWQVLTTQAFGLPLTNAVRPAGNGNAPVLPVSPLSRSKTQAPFTSTSSRYRKTALQHFVFL